MEGGEEAPSDPEDWEEWDPSSGSFLVHMTAGSVAGVAEHLIVFPLDTVKTHLQTRSTVSPAQRRRTLKSELRQMPLRAYRGVSASMAGCLPAHAAYFSVYEATKLRLGASSPGHHPLAAGMAGALASFAHDAIMTPLDVCKQRMQLGLHTGGLVDCIREVARVEGPGALYRSLPTTLIMNLPYGAVMVATNESMKTLLNPSGEHNTGALLVSGGVAGATAAAATNPLDVAKTRLQTQHYAADLAQPASTTGSGSSSASTTSSGNSGLGGGRGATSSSSGSSRRSGGAGSSSQASRRGGHSGGSNPFGGAGARGGGGPSTHAAIAAPGACGRGAATVGNPAATAAQGPGMPLHGKRGICGLSTWGNHHRTLNAAAGRSNYSGSGNALRRAQPPISSASSSSSSWDVGSGRATHSGRVPGNGGGGAGGGTPYYRGLFDACSRIYAEEGVAAFGSGLRYRLLSHAPAVAVSWTTYESIKALLR